MFGLSADATIFLTVVAAFLQSAVLMGTIILFYKNLLELKKDNKINVQRFDYQKKTDKYSLSFDFADWIKEELEDYLPYVLGDKNHDVLSPKVIKVHFDNIAKNLVYVVENDLIYTSLIVDEIRKLSLAIQETEGSDDLSKELEKIIKS